MRNLRGWLAGAALLTLGLAGAVFAQKPDSPYLVFAKAGRINYVAGSVTRQRATSEQRESLVARDNLEAGDLARTGAYGRVEVLLNPGSYLRANTNTEFALVNTDLDSLRVRLVKGSFLFEVLGPEDYKTAFTVETPHGVVNVSKRGIYRFDVNAVNSVIIVQKGRAFVGSQRVNGGQQIVLGSGATQVSKFDKKMLDAFDNWSKERSGTLADLNSRITDRAIRAAMSSTAFNAGFGRGHGVWVFDQFRGLWTFLPFGGNSWGSPYGWSYGFGLNSNDFFDYWRWMGNGMNGGGNGGSGGGGGNTITVTREAPDVSPGPPRRDSSLGGGGKSLLITRDVGGGFGGSTRDSGFNIDSPSPSPRIGNDSGSSKSSSPPPPASAPNGAEVDRSGGSSVKKPDNR